MRRSAVVGKVARFTTVLFPLWNSLFRSRTGSSGNLSIEVARPDGAFVAVSKLMLPFVLAALLFAFEAVETRMAPRLEEEAPRTVAEPDTM